MSGHHTDLNRSTWDAWATVHGQDGYYDSEGLVAGRDSLTDLEWDGVRAAVGDVAGRDVLHVQCHLAFDAITLARHGARVTGLDFAPAALAKARDLATRCGVALELVEGDATDLPARLRGRFDLAYATIGILCWIDDVGAWMRSVAGALRPGGRLLLIDGHPLSRMVQRIDPLVLGFPYANDGPHIFESSGSYAATTPAPTTNVLYAHSLGEVVTAAADAGLRILRLVEHLDSPLGEDGGGAREADGRHRLRIGGYCVPVLYTLIAERAL